MPTSLDVEQDARSGSEAKSSGSSQSVEESTVRPPSIMEDLIRPALVEFITTAIFLFFNIGHILFNVVEKNADGSVIAGAYSLTSGGVNILAIAISFGLMIFVLAYCTANLSGACINPAVTVALMATRRFSLVKGLVYIFAQCAGACVGCGLVVAIAPDVMLNDGYLPVAYNKVFDPFTPGAAFCCEAMGTALLMFTVMAAIDPQQAKDAKHIAKVGPLAIGISVTLAHLVLCPMTNCSINPARTFGASVAANNWEDHYVFWLGPCTGAIVTAFVYDLILDKKKDSASCASYSSGPDGW